MRHDWSVPVGSQDLRCHIVESSSDTLWYLAQVPDVQRQAEVDEVERVDFIGAEQAILKFDVRVHHVPHVHVDERPHELARNYIDLELRQGPYVGIDEAQKISTWQISEHTRIK